jgi:hypothetical protein
LLLLWFQIDVTGAGQLSPAGQFLPAGQLSFGLPPGFLFLNLFWRALNLGLFGPFLGHFGLVAGHKCFQTVPFVIADPAPIVAAPACSRGF